MGYLGRISLVTALAAAVWVILPTAGMAQLPLPPVPLQPSPSPSPSPTNSSSPEPSSSPSPTKGTSSGSGSTSSGSSGSSGGSTSPSGGSGGSSGSSSSRSSGGSTARPAAVLDPVVEEGLRLWRERDKTPARTTTRLLELLRDAYEGEGDPPAAVMREGFGRFPVVGYVWYQDDYGAPRYSPYYSAHAGTDLFAVRGTPVIAVTDGYIWRSGYFSKGGWAIWLMGDDGVRYYYGHLDRIVKGLKTGDRVEQGQFIATVGNTGNAIGTYPHVHFEINPGGLGTVNPKPILDRWLDDAETTILTRLSADRTREHLASFGAARWDRLVDLFAEPGATPPLLWAAGFGGTGGLLATVDTALWDLLSLFDLRALTPPVGAGGQDAIPLDPIAALLALAHSDS